MANEKDKLTQDKSQDTACDLDDEGFESYLDDQSKEKAKRELNEINDRDRLLAVDTLRTWVKQQAWLKSPTGTEFLIRQLRVRKYGQLSARESLENYWTSRTKHPNWFENVDPCDPLMEEILRSGIYISPLKTDSDGCRVLIARFGFMDIEKVKKVWKTDNLVKALFMIYEWATTDENVQVNGIKIFVDYTDLTMAHVMAFTDQQGAMMSYFQKALPMRMKGIFLYNEPTFFDVIYSISAPFMSDKVKSRMHLMGKNMAKVYEKIEKSLLPDEYLPDDYEGPSAGSISKQLAGCAEQYYFRDMTATSAAFHAFQSFTNEMVADMQKPKFRNYMRQISAPGVYGVNLEMRKKDSKNSVPVASFRKLNVD